MRLQHWGPEQSAGLQEPGPRTAHVLDQEPARFHLGDDAQRSVDQVHRWSRGVRIPAPLIGLRELDTGRAGPDQVNRRARVAPAQKVGGDIWVKARLGVDTNHFPAAFPHRSGCTAEAAEQVQHPHGRAPRASDACALRKVCTYPARSVLSWRMRSSFALRSICRIDPLMRTE